MHFVDVSFPPEIAKDAVAQESKEAFCSGYFLRKIGEYGQRAGGNTEPIHKPNGWHCERIPIHVVNAALEWGTWGKYLKTAEYSKERSGDGARAEMVDVSTNGGLKTAKSSEPVALTRKSGNFWKSAIFSKSF